MKSKRYGGKSHHHWYILFFMMKCFELFLKITGLYKRGIENAEDIKVRELDLAFDNLPLEFDGFKILHLSDLHLDGMPGLEDKVVKKLEDHEVDLCVLTGDYRTELHGPIRTVIQCLERMIKGIKSNTGFLGILGNHDDCHMVRHMEEMGIHMLINEVYRIEKNGEFLQFIGTDDAHYYYTDQALHALEQADSAFSIALVHSPELFDYAADMGVRLYLCGHTHGGQVCLPGGYPIIKHLNRGKGLYRGLWDYQGMKGITSCGVGTSGIPVRFNTRGELLILKLRRNNVN